jgi:ABC transport system ATP-binding/permease protein
VMEQVADLGGETVTFGDQKLAVRAFLRRFLFSEDRVRERVDRLSGGERARLLLAKVLKRGGNLIVLDEPTNDLDLASLRMLEEALADFSGSALMVSHDRYFLDRVCDQIVAFEDGGVFVQPGNYSYYLEKRRERETRRADSWASPPSAAAPKSRVRKLSFKEQRELETMEETLLGVEGRVAELEALLNDPAFYITRSQEASGLQEELESARAEVERLYARWAELEAVGK